MGSSNEFRTILVGLIFILNRVLSSPLTLKTDVADSIGKTIADEETFIYRLPNNTKPLSYEIYISTDIHKGQEEFNGAVRIKLSVLEANTDTISVNIKELVVNSVILVEKNVEQVELFKQKTIVGEVLTVTSTVPLDTNKNYFLTITYEGVLRDDNRGFYRSSYIDKNGDTVWLAATQFESTNARHAFPCFDEPAIKATFSITIRHGLQYNALSNMPKDSAVQDKWCQPDIDYMCSIFQYTPRMSSYLVAFIISDFETTTETRDYAFSVSSRRGTKAWQSFALLTGGKTLTALEGYFSVDFAIPKMDQVAIPDFAAGAMENWGLVTYREEDLLINDKTASTTALTRVATTIAHEFSHQWFGNLVSPAWWSYIWLNEGFATMFSYIGTNLAYPSWEIMDEFIYNEFQQALAVDQTAAARQMTYYVEAPNDIESVFDTISYSKAGSVLRMIEHFLTEPIFKRGLKKYLKKKAYQAVDEGDLIYSLEQAAREDKHPLVGTSGFSFADAFLGWTHQTGVPLVTLTRDYEAGKFSISQSRFNVNGTTDKTLWVVPVNYASASHPDFSETSHQDILTTNSYEVSKSSDNETFNQDDWIILNKQSAYYYRVNYDEKNWALISKALNANPSTIHKYNRAQLLDDAYYLLLAKKISVTTFFELYNYLQQEDEYVVWVTAASVLDTLDNYFYNEEDYNDFRYFVQNLIAEPLSRYVLKVKDLKHFDPVTSQLLTNLAIKVDFEDHKNKTQSKLQSVIKNNTELDPNIQESVYCYGQTGSDEELNFLFKKFQDSSDQTERKTLISAFGCSPNSKHLEFYLETTIGKDADTVYRPHERNLVLAHIYTAGHEGLEASIQFLKKYGREYSQVLAAFNKINTGLVALRGIAKCVVTGEQKNQFEELLEASAEWGDIVSTTEKENLLKTIDLNIGFLSDTRNEIFAWLKSFKTENTDGSANNFYLSAFAMTLLVFVAIQNQFY